MHFSIPETEVRSCENGSTYVAYNIHVNGVLHCRVRYSQLLGLHEQIKKEYGNNVVPAFPPKKIFTLTPAEVEQRREQLEKYMQAVRQDPLLGASEMFNSFLRKAQQETQQIPTEEVQLEVHLSNSQKVKVNILTSDQTEDVLEAVASKLELPDELVGYFSLFLVQNGVNGGCTYRADGPGHSPAWPCPTRNALGRLGRQTAAPPGSVVLPWASCVVRKLQEFELPYVSVTSLHNPDYHIVLRKSYWDMAYDSDVMEDSVGLNLLYSQTVSDIERGWILANKDQHRQLKSLQEKGSKKEFIRLAQTLKYFGYIKFDPCITDFPEKGCHVIVSAGNNELNFHVKLPNNHMKEGSFKVTRMRCWRVTSSQVPVANGTANPCTSSKCEIKLELAFEYLMSKDRLQWVTITSPQAIMMSICLQSMVDELMVKKSGGSIKKKKRLNGSIHRSNSQQAVKSPPLLDSPDANREQVVKLSTKLSSVSLRGISASNSANDLSGSDFHGNYAFEGIGDDDL
ncbi:sorting nexin-17 isoform X1 [Neoarius graeffei]|uniref:sorting nexin-17 isoform X1 n=1 Tax=Neoarius graeffei TaxID=443677 RepID=UPI00298C6A7F|nr:sorting nexin-17 isoform X1 [Neoarius graeffei]